MPIPLDQARHVARLARLALSDEALRPLAAQLDAVLALADELGAVDTTGVEPMQAPGAATAAWRADLPAPSLPVATLLALAPDSADGFVCVPQVVGEP